MKKIRKSLVFILIAIAIGLAVENVNGKGFFPFKTRNSSTASDETADQTVGNAAVAGNSETARSASGSTETGKRTTGTVKRRSGTGKLSASQRAKAAQTNADANRSAVSSKPQSKNPFTAIFGEFKRKKDTPQESEVELPSSKSTPSTEIVKSRAGSAGNSGDAIPVGSFENEVPKNQQPPFAPSYGVDRSAEGMNSIPDQVYLEDEPSENAIPLENSSLESPQTEFANAKDPQILSDIPEEQVKTAEVPQMADSHTSAPVRMPENSAADAGIPAQKDFSGTPAAESEMPSSSAQNRSSELSISAPPAEDFIASDSAQNQTKPESSAKTDHSPGGGMEMQNSWILEPVDQAALDSQSSRTYSKGTVPRPGAVTPNPQTAVSAGSPQKNTPSGLASGTPKVSAAQSANASKPAKAKPAKKRPLRLEFMETGDFQPEMEISSQRLDNSAPVLDMEMEDALTNEIMDVSSAGPSVSSPTQKEMRNHSNSSASLKSVPKESSARIETRVGNSVSLADSEISEETIQRANLDISIEPPERVIVGSDAIFKINASNISSLTSEGTSIEIRIPDGFDVSNCSSFKGKTEITHDSVSGGQICVWKIGTLQPETSEILLLTLLPKERVQADIQVSWSNLKNEIRKAVIVDEPKLDIQINSSSSVTKDAETPLRIYVTNTGTCAVKDIHVQLETDGCAKTEHVLPGIYALFPGEREIIETSVLPRSEQEISVRANALVQKQTLARTEKKMPVEFTQLDIQIPSIDTTFVGMETQIPVQIRNEGNAPAKNMKLYLKLPESVRFIKSLGTSNTKEVSGNYLRFTLDTIPPGGMQELTFLTEIQKEGTAEIPLSLQLNSKTIHEESILVSAEGVANVKMELNFPNRILSTDENVFYEVKLVNTGSRKIENGKLYLYFSDGIEPIETDRTAEVMDQGVVCFNVPELLIGETQIFQIQADVHEPGNYQVRGQLQCEGANLDLMEQKTMIYR